MDSKLLSRVILVLVLVFNSVSFAQTYQQVNYSITEVSKAESALLGTPQIQASDYKVFQMDIDAIKAQMTGVGFRENPSSGFIAQLSFPHPDGSMHNYQARGNQTMDPALAALFPEIKSYDAAGVNNGAKVKWDITPQGFHAMIMLPNESTIYIDPLIQGNTDYYIVYHKKDFYSTKQMLCEFSGQSLLEDEFGGTIKSFGTCELRTYRAAIAATGEYTTFHGGTVALAQAAQVTTMNRVNGCFERDMAVTMTIIANNNLLIYTNAATDPYANGNPGTMITQNQTNVNTIIGNANYDIGHVFGTNSGGLAGLGVVCVTNQKARGVTGSGAPIGDPFDIDYVAHEMGHQFGCNHTFNNSCGGNRNNATAMEPGSGTTIMAYAGICAPDIQSNSDDHFHGISLQEMGNHLASTNCPVITALANSAPNITGTNGNITVPANTPFALTAFATDPDGDVLSYCWEQMDNGISTQAPVGTSTIGPNFRSNPPINNPTRYFPNLTSLAAGGPFTWEVIPTVTRTMNFRVTVRDQSLGVAGCNDHADVTITTDAGSGPFIVQYPSVTGIVWAGLTSETVTWSVANTNVAPVACSLVDILLSTDGGLTYPTVLASGVPNDGSQPITVPNIATTTARIMVICSNGTFFDISNNNFQITMASFDYSLGASPLSINICQPNDAVYTVNIGSVGGFNDPVALSVTGVPAGATFSFSVNPVTPVGTSTLTISNTGAAAPGVYTITITGNSTTGIKTTNVELIITSANPTPVVQIIPLNGATSVSTPTAFSWTTSPTIGVTYEIEIATDAGFASIVDQATGLPTASYTSTVLLGITTYYWRVRSVTNCGTSAWSLGFSFTTLGCFQFTPTNLPVTIPTAGPVTVSSSVNVPIAGTINDVNVIDLIGTHTRIKDLIITLTSPLGTVVTLMNQVCNNQDNFNVDFDDAAASAVLPCPPVDGNPYQPNGLLSAFNGESATGTWTLTITDVTNLQGGALTNWILEICVDPPVSCINPDIPTLIAGSTVCPNTATTLSVGAANLNDATSWEWYTGTCGGTSAGSGANLVVNPAISTTYYVRGEGGCAVPGVCASVTVNVEDSNAPTVTCPGNQIENFNAACQFTLPDYTSLVTVIDNCDASPVITQSPIPGSVIFGNATITITATDASGNVGACAFDVVPNDATPPTISCPGNQTTCLTTMPDYSGLVVATDNCGTLTIVQSPSVGTPITGTTLVTMTATDGNSNVSTCTFSVLGALTFNETATATICSGQTYNFGTQALTSAGVYTELFTSTSGCDSSVVLSLNVNPTYNETAIATICAGQTYNFGTQALTSAGVYTELFTSTSGCDSSVVLSLNVNPTYNETATATICAGQTYNFGSQTLTSTGVYTELFSSMAGCDSLVVLTLNVSSGFLSNENATICEGQTYLFPDGSAGTTTQVYTSVLSNSIGCDSTIVTALTVHPVYNITEAATICDGETYTFPDGSFGTTAQTHTSTLTTASGCDSLIITVLDVQMIDNSITLVDQTITANQTGALYQWIDCANNNPIAGEVNQSFIATAVNGNYAVIVTIGNCSDTSDCVNIDLSGLDNLYANSILIYPNPTDDIVNIEWEGKIELIEVTDVRGRLVERIDNLSGQAVKINLTKHEAGVYFIRLQNQNGSSVYDIMKY